MIGIVGKNGLIGSNISTGHPILSRFHNDRKTIEKEIVEKGLTKILLAAGNSNSKNYLDEDYQLELQYAKNLLLGLSKSPGSAFFFCSSAHVYGAQKSWTPIEESQNPNPVTMYGEKKLHLEIELSQHAQELGIAMVSLRIFSIFSRFMKSNFLSGRIQRDILEGKKEITIQCADDIRDFSTPRMIGQKIQAVLMTSITPNLDANLVLNVCSGSGMTVKDRVKMEFENDIKMKFESGYSEIPYLVGKASRFNELVTGNSTSGC